MAIPAVRLRSVGRFGAALFAAALAVLITAPSALALPACPPDLGGSALDPTYGTTTPDPPGGILEHPDIPGRYSLFCGYGEPYESIDRWDYSAIVTVTWAEVAPLESPATKCGSWFNPDALVTPNEVTVGDTYIEWTVFYERVDQHYLTGVDHLAEAHFKVFDGFPLGLARTLAADLFDAAAETAAPCPVDGPNALGLVLPESAGGNEDRPTPALFDQDQDPSETEAPIGTRPDVPDPDGSDSGTADPGTSGLDPAALPDDAGPGGGGGGMLPVAIIGGVAVAAAGVVALQRFRRPTTATGPAPPEPPPIDESVPGPPQPG